jgi:replicative DNA helicase
MKGGELIVVMGGTKEGKSVCLLNIAYHLQAKLGKNIFFLSAENSRAQLERRYSSLHSGIPYNNIRSASSTPEEEEHYFKCLEEERNMPGIFYIWDNPISTSEALDAKILELESRYKFDAIIVDYLSLVLPKMPTKDQHIDVGNVALDLRTIARKRNIPVITACQVNRIATKNKSAAYENTDISFSYAVIQHADTVLTIRVQNPDILNSGCGTCDILARLTKNRDGAQGEFSIDASFDRMKLKERSFIIK